MIDPDYTKVLWKFYPLMDKQDKKALYKIYQYMPEKGYGGIFVSEGQVDSAISLLKEYVGDIEFEYYPEGFISDNHLPVIYYGKFDIENPPQLFQYLSNNGITIINVKFLENDLSY